VELSVGDQAERRAVPGRCAARQAPEEERLNEEGSHQVDQEEPGLPGRIAKKNSLSWKKTENAGRARIRRTYRAPSP
jgi:hypothetical protein